MALLRSLFCKVYNDGAYLVSVSTATSLMPRHVVDGFAEITGLMIRQRLGRNVRFYIITVFVIGDNLRRFVVII